LTMRQPHATISQPVQFEAIARSFGSPTDEQRYTVELSVDGQRSEEHEVEIPAGKVTAIRFSYQFFTPGSHFVEVRIGPDRLQTDNHAWLAVNVHSHLEVLCVSGDYQAAYYLSRALSAGDENATQPQVHVISESELVEQDLRRFDCVFLCNLSQFTQGETQVLNRYVRGGGGLVFFLGDRVLTQRYNQSLANERTPAERILPVTLSGVADEGNYRFDPLGYAHPVVLPFRDREQAGLLTTPVFRYHRMSPLAAAPTARVVLSFENGDPAIVEEPLGRGTVFVVAVPSSLDRTDPSPWTLFPAWPSFLPVVQEMLNYVVAARDQQFRVQVGDPIGMTMAKTSERPEVSLTDPNGHPLSVDKLTENRETGWVYEDTSISGVYTAKLGSPISTTQFFAVNIDPRESDLSKTSPGDLPKQLLVQTGWQNLEEDSGESIIQQTNLHRWLIYSAIVLLLAEIYVAWNFGRARA